MIRITAVGGYNEVGRNMTAIEIDDEVIILDMGLHLENYIKYTADEDILDLEPAELAGAGAIPDTSVIKSLKRRVKAIALTHAHLDHVGAVPFLAKDYDAPILCTPFTAEVIRAIAKDENIKIKNKIRTLTVNSIYKVSKNVTIEFINITHSTPQTVMIALHTKYGIILYANDFKFDMFPTLGKPVNTQRLKELQNENVLALIVDCVYAEHYIKMPSESVAREMLKDVLLATNSQKKAIVVTTFSSHLARLKSIIELGKKLNRKIVFLGRSLVKYVGAGENIGIINFSKNVEMVKYSSQIKRKLKQIMKKGKHKFLLVVTGHQGEPKATLSKMADGKVGFKFDREDHIIFSCTVIPTPTNKHNREVLEEKLKAHHVRIFKDIHVSGHAAREDLRDLINMVRPKHLIPSHGEMKMEIAFLDLASEMRYKKGKNVHLLRNRQSIVLK